MRTKYLCTVLLGVLAIFMISMPASASPLDKNESVLINSTAKVPDTIYWSIQVVGYKGATYFYSVAQYGYLYRGYLASDGSNIGGIYTYKGKLYRDPLPYPFPNIIKPVE